MAYENPRTIRETLTRIHQHDYVLPAIQREFVWGPGQIARLFDSLMRGYPIGSFLFWEVEREHVRDFRYYDFVRDFHERDHAHCPPLDVPPDRSLTAILDGQQRLTALNIGLRGSYAAKEPRKWWTSPDAFPVKYLYLNLLANAPENEDKMVFDFRFLTPERAGERSDQVYWFRVRDIIDLEAGPDLLDYLTHRDVPDANRAFRRLHDLHDVVHRAGVIHFYLEKEQDLDRVLDIFIRVNSGGTVLSYSDLLLSIATAQWQRLPAREAIHDLVDSLNDTRLGFSFSKDFVLKAGLMLADVASVGFKVTNFTRANMLVLEDRWSAIARALKLTVRLVADFGFSSQTLSADSALLPIAYYLYQREATEAFLTRVEHRSDRDAIRGWLIRSLLKPGVWGSGLDVTLTAIRTVVREHGSERFPVAEIQAEMARRGRSLRFVEEEIEDLADIRYGDRRLFPLLALMFPHVDLRNQFHIDHIFPRNAFQRRTLRTLGIAAPVIEEMREQMDRLGNLQLLEGSINEAKQDVMPAEWMERHFPRQAERAEYLRIHDIPALPASMEHFSDFYIERRDRLVSRLREMLGVRADASEVGMPA